MDRNIEGRAPAALILFQSGALPLMHPVKSHEFRGTPRFQILAVLGEGGGGVVYEALDLERNARVALKTLRVADPERLLLLKKEFRAVQDLAHPNLATPHELFEEDGQWFFTMDVVAGGDFVAYVCPGAGPTPRTPTTGAAASHRRMKPASLPPPRPTRSFDEARLRAALGQLVRGLSALHGVQKVHRDVKPSNVLVDASGRVVILDFGVVSDIARERSGGQGLIGTAHYMAPEQAAEESIGPAADWYAVGTMLYQALTGSLPFVGTLHEVLEQKCVMEPPPPSALAPGIPEDLDRLCVDLLRLEPGDRPSAPEILRRLGLQGDVVTKPLRAAAPIALVGRHAELAFLQRAFDRTQEGSAVTVLVHGESGVGKSFLVRSFADAVEAAARVTILRGRCYEREAVPYKAIDGVVDDLTFLLREVPADRLLSLLPQNVGILSRAFPVLAQVPQIAAAPVAAGDIENAQELRARVFRALRDLLAKVACWRPLVVVIDDLQWADADSLALLAEVMRPPDEPPLLLLGTIRVGTLPQGTSRLEEAKALPGDVRSIELDALPAKDAHQLIAQLLGGGDDDARAATIDAIAAEAKGHPLFIDELVRQQSLGAKDGAPLRLDDALWARISRLDERSRALVELVATAGVPLPQETMARAMDLAFGPMFDVVTTLRVGNLVRTAGAARTAPIEAYHDRVRESVLAHLAPERRMHLHRRLALALEHDARVDPELLSAHWQGAGDDARAAEYASRAADQAFAALAFDHAATLYRRALDLGRPAEAERRALQMKLAEALVDAGRGGEAAQIYLALGGDETSTDALELQRRAAEQFLYTGHFERGVATLRALLASLGERFPAGPLTAVLLVVLYRFLVRLRGLALRPLASEAIDRRELLVIDTLNSASAGFGMTDHTRGAYFNARAVHIALRARDAARLARALSVEAASCSASGTPSLAYTSRMSGRALEIAPLANQPFAQAYAEASVGWVAYFTGQWRRAIDGLQRGEAIFRERCVGRAFEVNTVRAVLYRALLVAGALNDLAVSAGATMRSAEQRGDLFVTTGLRATVFYFLALANDQPKRAREELTLVAAHLAEQQFHAQHMHHLMAAGQVDLYGGDPEAALARLAHRWPTLRRSFLLRIQVSRIGFLDQRARCHLAIAASTATTRAAHVRAATREAAAIERENAPWGDALAGLLRAQIAALRGDADGAIPPLRASVDALARLDMPLHAAAARRRLGELLGGDEGRALIGEADAWMYGQNVQSPANLAALFAPGFAARGTPI